VHPLEELSERISIAVEAFHRWGLWGVYLSDSPTYCWALGHTASCKEVANMTENALNLIEPRVLNESLPSKPYGVDDWGFVLNTAQVTFVVVSDFDYRPSVYLRGPVVLGVRLAPGAVTQASPEYQGVFAIEDGQANMLCTARWRRQIGDVWDATFHDSTQQQIGKASGTLGTHTSPHLVEAALVAMVRHAVATYS
jgi:hypothetical protein